MLGYRLNHLSMICALGHEEDSIMQALLCGSMPPLAERKVGEKTHLVAAVQEALPPIAAKEWDTRLNSMLLFCLQGMNRAWAGVEPRRLGVVLGCSNAGIQEFQDSCQPGMPYCADEWKRMECGSPALFVAERTGAKGPAYTINTACSSAAKAFVCAARMLDAGVCDAVITGGGDSLCDFALNGFDSLHLLAGERSLPLTGIGNGINHGEGAALFLLTKEERIPGGIYLDGWGESSDASHPTTPEPQGIQPMRAMTQALTRAGLQPGDIDYVNMHGTGTIANDTMELHAINTLFAPCPPLYGSTKPYTGHTLGASGAIEAAICCLLLEAKTCRVPLSPWLQESAPAESRRMLTHCMSNSFAFGGNNASLIFSRA